MVAMLAPDFDGICARGAVSDEDILALRRKFFLDGVISAEEAEAFFKINRHCSVWVPAWPELFVEALTDFTVRQALPQGYVTCDNANWLMDRISEDGVVCSETEFELLLNVIETARWCPPSLVAYALNQVRTAVIEGSSRTGHKDRADAGRVTACDVATIRRVLFAFGGDGNVAVTRAEAEVLFDINDATAGARNDPEWAEVFVKSIANHLMWASGYEAPPREEALRQERWLDAPNGGTLDFLGRMLSGGISGIRDAYRAQTFEEMQLDKLERDRLEMITQEAITREEAEWVAERIGRDGKLHDNERALLSFLKTESPNIHPSLKPLIDQAA